jgi:hypothetical protein
MASQIKSDLLMGIGEDAAYIADHIEKRRLQSANQGIKIKGGNIPAPYFWVIV